MKGNVSMLFFTARWKYSISNTAIYSDLSFVLEIKSNIKRFFLVDLSARIDLMMYFFRVSRVFRKSIKQIIKRPISINKSSKNSGTE